MTPTEELERATEFLEGFYEKIKHGDEAHRAWLRNECAKMAPELARIIAARVESALANARASNVRGD